MRRNLSAIILAVMLFAAPVSARSGGHSYGYHSHSSTSGTSSHKKGKKKRSKAARNSFQESHPCPANGHKSGACPGYVVDHIQPLKRGGADAPDNMQWQTKEDAKAKDKWE